MPRPQTAASLDTAMIGFIPIAVASAISAVVPIGSTAVLATARTRSAAIALSLNVSAIVSVFGAIATRIRCCLDLAGIAGGYSDGLTPSRLARGIGLAGKMLISCDRDVG